VSELLLNLIVKFRSCRVYGTSNHKCLHNIHKNTSSTIKNGQV